VDSIDIWVSVAGIIAAIVLLIEAITNRKDKP
jgi:hypothetical protein